MKYPKPGKVNNGFTSIDSGHGYSECYLYLDVKQPKNSKEIKNKQKSNNDNKQSLGGILDEPLYKPDGKNSNSKNK